MSARDHLNPVQFSYDRDTVGQVTAHGPGVSETRYTRGSGIRQERHPSDMPAPLYHGSPQRFQPGDQVEPGHPGNFVTRMKHVYASEDPGRANHYAFGGGVYEVQPTGWYGHRKDARGPDWASEEPMKVLREVSWRE